MSVNMCKYETNLSKKGKWQANIGIFCKALKEKKYHHEGSGGSCFGDEKTWQKTYIIHTFRGSSGSGSAGSGGSGGSCSGGSWRSAS